MRGLEAGYDVDHRLIGKRLVDFLLVIIELFSLGSTSEELGPNIDWKSPFIEGVGHFGLKFLAEGDIPTDHLLSHCGHVSLMRKVHRLEKT